MRLIIMGCEYAGKSTLVGEIKKWLVDMTGSCNTSFHDHFVLPFHEGTGPEVEAEAQQVLGMMPSLQEKYSRYLIDYHLNYHFYLDNDHGVVNWFYGDTVYAEIYYNYGKPGEYGSRGGMARGYEARIMEIAPDTVLILVKASPEVIKRRMQQNPHPFNILKEEDVELVLHRFEEEFHGAMIRKRFALDTTNSSIEETFHEFRRLIEPHISQADRLRIISHQLINR